MHAAKGNWPDCGSTAFVDQARLGKAHGRYRRIPGLARCDAEPGVVCRLVRVGRIGTGVRRVGSLERGFRRRQRDRQYDGALARKTSTFSEVGAFLDSTFDRIGEAAALAGVAVFLARQGSDVAVGAIVLALLGGSLTSYVRARAESLGIECTVGWISRTERVFIMGVLLVVHLPTVMAYVLALASSALPRCSASCTFVTRWCTERRMPRWNVHVSADRAAATGICW
jgi:hypothetical protein